MGATIVLAAGGTGGHMFPAEALARELAALGNRLVLVTDRRGGAYGGGLSQIETFRIHAGGIAGGGALGKLRGFAEILVGEVEAERLLSRLRPQAVVGFGGYASVPTMLAAVRRGLPTLIHEQNAVLGRANRLLAPRVRRIATSFERVFGLRPADREKVRRTGNPVRPAIAALSGTPYPALDADAPVRLLVLGGSQGARAFSHLLPAAMAGLPEPMRRRIRIDQQCRAEDIARVACVYARVGVAACLSPFFDDVPRRLARTHLAICRSGASTVAEMAAAGRPAIFIPYPHATDDHQQANARAVEEAGGGWVMAEAGLCPGDLAGRIVALLGRPDSLVAAGRAAAAFGLPDAAHDLAMQVEALIGGNGAGGGARGVAA